MKVSARNNSSDYIFARRAHIFARVSFDIDRTMFAWWARGWSGFSEISFLYALFCSRVGLWDGASARDFGESAMFFAVAEKKKTIDMNAHGFVSRDEVVRASGATSRRCSCGRFSSRPIFVGLSRRVFFRSFCDDDDDVVGV